MKKFYTQELHRLSTGLLIILTLLIPFLLDTGVQAEEQELPKVKRVIYTFNITDARLDDREVASGTSQEQLNLPSSLLAGVEKSEKDQQLEVPVTWTAHPQYDRDTPGEYRFTAVPAEEYTLADNLTAPGITITVTGADKDNPKEADETEAVQFNQEKSVNQNFSNQPFSFDIASGSVVIEPDTTSQSDIQVTQGSTVTRGIASSDTIELYSSSGATVNHSVMVRGGVETNITAKGINIKSPSGDGFSITENSTVTLTIVGNNYITASGSYYAGVLVLPESTLIIEDGGGGYLEAYGGNYSAGIGGATSYDGGKCGKIVINGGNIVCCANKWNAILGGPNAHITINGGKVTNIRSKADYKKGIQADILILNGGTVVAGGHFDKGIECNTAIIDGGSLYTHNEISGNFINGAGLPVSQNRIDASSVYGPNEMVNAGELDVLMARLHTTLVPDAYSNLYGVSDVYTDSSANVYLWLPRVNMPLTDIEDPSSVKDYDNSGLPERITAKYLSTPVTLKLLNQDDYSSSAVYQWQLNGKDIEGATAQTLEAKDIGTYTLNITDGGSVSSYRQIIFSAVYTLAFDSNGGEGVMPDQTKNYGEELPLNPNEYTKTGYTFTGWNTQADGGGTVYGDGENVKNLTTVDGEVVKLYAQWRPNKYSVQFDGNTADGGSMGDQAMTYDEAADLELNSYTKTGYTYKGWNTQPDGSGTAYTDGEEVSNLTTADGETVLLYAQWRLRTPSIVTSQSAGKHGDTVTVTGEDFEPNAEVTFTLHSTPKEVGKAPADTEGKVTLTFQVPFDTEEGDHQLRADNGIHSAQTGFKVLKTAKADPEKNDTNTNGASVGTGIQSYGYIPPALVLILCGIAFGLLLRRNKLG